MSYDDDWPDQTMDARRKMVRETLRRATIKELEELGEKRFPVVNDPWCERYFDFLKQNPSAEFYRAEIPGGTELVYCRDAGKAMWFMPGHGMGVVQSKGLQALKGIVDAL